MGFNFFSTIIDLNSGTLHTTVEIITSHFSLSVTKRTTISGDYPALGQQHHDSSNLAVYLYTISCLEVSKYPGKNSCPASQGARPVLLGKIDLMPVGVGGVQAALHHHPQPISLHTSSSLISSPCLALTLVGQVLKSWCFRLLCLLYTGAGGWGQGSACTLCLSSCTRACPWCSSATPGYPPNPAGNHGQQRQDTVLLPSLSALAPAITSTPRPSWPYSGSWAGIQGFF